MKPAAAAPTAAVLASCLLLLSAGPAAASTTTAPAQVTEHGEVALSGVIEEPPAEQTGVAELRLSGPGATAVPVARSARPSPEQPRRDPSRVSFSLLTAPCNLPVDLCAEGTVLPNGAWTVQLFEVERPGGDAEVERGAASTFVVDVPAFRPQDVTAVLEGRTVTVRWARGVGPDRSLVEPDVRWTVDDGRGRSLTVDPVACVGARCSAVLRYPDGAAPGRRSFTVAAARPGSAAPAVSPAEGEVVVPPVPRPGGSAPGSPAGPSAAGSPDAEPAGSGQATAQSFAQEFGSFAPGLGLPGLPQPPGTPPVDAPQVADTFGPTLGYEDRFEDGPVPEPQAAPRGRESVLTSSGGLLDDEVAVRSVAGALVLLLAGAHLRTWLAGSRPTHLG